MNNLYLNRSAMRTFSRLLVLPMMLLFAMVFSAAYSQSISNYSFSSSVTGNLDDLSSGSTSLLTGNNDDVATTVNPIGFNFYFMGTLYTHFSTNSNGQVQLHTSATATAISGSATSPSAGTALLFPMTGDNEVNGGMRYIVTGTAPNRKFVLEWVQFYAYYTNITNAGNMQMWLDEATGKITFVYGEIYNSYSSTVSRSIGISSGTTATTQGSVTVGATPAFTASATLTSNTFAAGSGTTTGSPLIANLGSSAQGSRVTYMFTPPAAVSTPTNLTFSGVGATLMTLNWTDNSTTEYGYLVYRSLDGVTYSLVSTLAANSVTYAATGLNPSTLYYWKVVAVSEASISGNLLGSQSTTAPALAGGTFTVGSGGTYQNLTTAFADINAQGLTGNVELQLITGYPAAPETYPIASSTATATGAYTVKVYPTVSGLSITSANTTGTLNLNNAANITFDGRVNQTGTTKDLVISNTNAGASYAVQFVNDASGNTLKYLNISSANTSASSGTVVFAGSTGTTGNDNNVIDHCDIKDGASNPLNGIYSAGTSTTVDNSGNSVTSSNIYNYFGAATASNGILLASNSSAWTITGNKFYQTATRTLTSGSQHRGINIITSSGSGYVVTDNVIGFASETGTGTTTYTGSAGRFFGIEITSSATGTASSVQGNTVSGISLTTTSGTTTAPGVFTGISSLAGSVSIGNVTPNVIGAASGTGAIVVTTSTSANIFGIHAASTGTLNIANNVIGSITGTGSAAGVYCGFTGINTTGSSTATTITGNTIGGSTANGITLNVSGTTTTSATVTGIATANSPTTLTVSNNTISNLTNYATGSSSALSGITQSNAPATATVSGNTISSLTLATGTLNGITSAGPATLNITTNTISGLTVTTANGTSLSAIYGIYNVGSPTNENCTGNQLSNFSIAGSNTATSNVVTGIHSNTGSSTIKNISGNSISALSFANSSTGTAAVNGINSQSGTSGSIYKNKIYNLSNANTSVTSGIVIGSGTTINVYNNVIGDLKSATASSGDAVRGISVTSTSASTTYRVYYNTVYLSATSSGTNFGTSGIFHMGSTTATTAALDLQNNIIINESTPNGTGVTAAFRRGTASSTNLASTSNRNLLYAGTPSATQVVYTDGTVQQTLANYLANVSPAGHDANSFTGESFTYGTAGSFFVSLTGSSTDFLRPVTGITTQAESGAVNISTPAITTDYASAIRAGNTGYTGTGTNPDVGAYEFEGITPAPVITLNSVTPGATTQCTATARVVSVTITTLSGTITGATIGYTVNGVAQTNISMTNTSGNIWEGTIPVPSPANAAIAWAVAAQNSSGLTSTYTGTPYADEPLYGATASITPSNTTLCSGSPATLTATVLKSGYNATIGSGTSVTTSTQELTAFCNRRTSYKMQILYTAAELSAAGLAAGNITSMSYTITSVGDATTNAAFTVKIGTSGLTALTDYVSSTSFTTVFPSATYTHAVGVNTITFSTPFNWDGTSNIVVEVSHNGINSINNAQTVYTTTAANMVAYGYNGATTGTLSTSRFNTIFNGVGPTTSSAISWSDGVTTVGTTNPLTVNPTVTTTYTATITALGCTVTPAPTATVTVNPLPSAPTATNSAQCGSQNPTATVASTSGLPSPIFNWYTVSTGGTALQSSTSTTFNQVVTTTTTFYVSETNASTLCEGPRTALTVTVSSADLVSLTAAPTSFCIGQSVTLTAANTNPTPLQNYTYSTVSTAGSGLETPAAGASLTVTPTLAGTYTYTLSAVDGGCAGSATATVTVNPLPDAAAAPAPADGATGICYSGTGATLTAVSWGAAANATNYDVYFGAGSLPGSVSANVTATTYSIGTLLANTTYHWKVVAKNACGDAVSSSEWTFTTGSAPCYCTPTGVVSSYWITNFTTANAVTNISNATGASVGGYGVYTGQSASQYPGQPLNLNISTNSGTHYFYVWIDYNDDGDFNDANENPVATTSYASSLATTYTVPAAAPVGSHRMRIANSWSGTITACGTATNGGEYEDYTFTVLPLCPTTVTATPASRCGSGTLALSATGSAGTLSYSWYSTAMGGTPIETVTTSSWTTPSISSTTTFYVTAFDGTCETSVRVPVTATVNPIPASFAITPATATICEGAIQNLASQGTVSATAILGTGTTAPGSTSYPNPLSAYYGGTKHQMIYTASELTAQGLTAGSSITSVSFDLNTFAANACTNFTIRMGNTALNALTGFVSGTSTVYGPTTFTPSATGIVTFTLTTPYTWNGTSNIILETVHNAGNSGNGSGTRTNTTTTSTATVYYGASDNVSGGISGFDALSSYGTSGTSTSRPNVRFAYTTTSTPSWTPAATLFTDAAATTAYTAGVSAASIYAKPTVTTTYTATYSNSYGCTATSTAVVTVNPLPVVSAGPDFAVCTGSPATLSGSGANSYTWNNGVTDGVSFTPSATQTYTVTGTDANGCVNTDQVVVTVNPLPVVSAGTDVFICTGGSVTLSGSGATSYTWDNGVSDGVAFTPTASGTYTVTGTDANGCSNTDQVLVTVGTPSSSTVAQTACASYTMNGTTYTASGTYTQIIANMYGCDSTITLNLTINQPSASSVSATACSSYTLNGTTYTASGTYTQTIPNAAGCDSTITLNLTINQPSASSVSATACGSYTWTENGSTYTASGAYTHMLTNAAGCDSVITLNLTINAIPVATATLSNYVLTASSGASYQWINCTTGTAVSGATSQTYAPAANGLYAVIVTNASGCSDTSACVNVTGLGVKELTADAINIFPNPTHNAVTIEMTVDAATVEVHDAAGKLLRIANVKSGDKIDLSEYETGVYLLNVKTEAGSSLTRVVKQ